ncbi:uncharacterized protein LOC131911818 [Peromyscus eremicus]|uniref:uncharacterized protein LOC131911818 n=1 Tax=Peromyscus eremicus TaxID=42410 RepID=UPI0027DDB0C1|nr:uncharacterized protein LOC131911818 [Peromyscus eremicus]
MERDTEQPMETDIPTKTFFRQSKFQTKFQTKIFQSEQPQAPKSRTPQTLHTKTDLINPAGRPFVAIPIITNKGPRIVKWLIDTGSEISIITEFTEHFKTDKRVIIQGIAAETEVPVIKLRLKLYNKEYEIEAASFNAPCNILGIKEIRKLFPDFLNNKRIAKVRCNLAEVKIQPIKLPHTPPTFTAQYPIKGGIKEITETIQTLLKEGIIEKSQSFNYNSPVWPVLKPNGKWRFTVDFRRVNEKTPKLPGQLPDVEDIFLRIKNSAPKAMATIDLSDMFFGIPLHPTSRELTTFTWQGQQYQFLRLPQGYLNSPIIAHNTLTTTLKNFEPESECNIYTYVDDIMIVGQAIEKVQSTLEKLIQHLRNEGWTINLEKVNKAGTEVKFLGVHWTTEGPTIPETVIDKLKQIKRPQNKTEVQHLIGLFAYWRQHIPYLQIILQPLYKITKKAQDFEWDQNCENAIKLVLEYINQYSHLYYIQPGDHVFVDILYMQGYGNWNIFSKNKDRETPIGFYCKKFPWSENKYSLFERTIWTAYEAFRTIHSLLKENHVTLRSHIPILDWVKAPGEAWAGLPMEGKVLQWKWYLQEFLRSTPLSAKGSVPAVSESILQSDRPMTPEGYIFPTSTPPQKQVPMGHWGTREYDPSLVNAWFTDGSATTVNNKVRWKAAAYRPGDGMVITDQGTDKSAQHAEVIAALLAIRQTIKDNYKQIYLYTDSWCVANGIAVWSGKWRNNGWKINGKDIWSKAAWQELDAASRLIKIIVYHVDAHTKKQDETNKNNEVVDKLASALSIKLKGAWKANIDPETGKGKIQREWIQVRPSTKDIPISTEEILKIHEQLGHIGTHALKSWFDKRNLKITWQTIRKAINSCNNCPKAMTRLTHNYQGIIGHRMDFNRILQIDFIGPLNSFKGKYCCTLVDITTGLGMARESTHPDQNTTILTVWGWCAAYGTPDIIQSDQGTHFTGAKTQRMARNLNIQWDFHRAYTPTAAGAIERWNGMIKKQLEMHKGMPLSLAIKIATYELNTRPRINRKSPIEEAIQKQHTIDYPTVIDREVIRNPNCLYRNRKNNKLSPAEIIAPGTGNNVWITQDVLQESSNRKPTLESVRQTLRFT